MSALIHLPQKAIQTYTISESSCNLTIRMFLTVKNNSKLNLLIFYFSQCFCKTSSKFCCLQYVYGKGCNFQGPVIPSSSSHQRKRKTSFVLRTFSKKVDVLLMKINKMTILIGTKMMSLSKIKNLRLKSVNKVIIVSKDASSLQNKYKQLKELVIKHRSLL